MLTRETNSMVKNIFPLTSKNTINSPSTNQALIPLFTPPLVKYATGRINQFSITIKIQLQSSTLFVLFAISIRAKAAKPPNKVTKTTINGRLENMEVKLPAKAASIPPKAAT